MKKKITIESTRHVPFDNPVVTRLLAQLDILYAAVPLDRFHYVKQPVAVPVEYKYVLAARDGRTWNQVLRFDVPNNPGQTFDVEDFWRLSEFTPHRSIRDDCIALTAQYEMVEIDVKWEE